MITDTYKTLLVEEYHSGFVKIILNRPEKRNALNPQLIADLKSVFSQLENIETCKGVIITGNGNTFCAGADLAYLKEIQNHSFQQNLNDSINLKDLYFQIYTFSKPVIAAVNGPAIAGGCGLASVCDFVISSDDSFFGYPEVKIGFVAALVSVFLINSIGERRAREILLSGDVFSAQQALNYGIINKTVQKNELWHEIDKFVSKLNSNSSTSLNMTKQLFYNVSNTDLEKKLDIACEMNAKSRQTQDFFEGISSFLEKKKPKWQIN